MKKTLLALCFLSFAVLPARAARIEGVDFSDTFQAGSVLLRLNGTGLLRYRKIIKAYVAALYLGPGASPAQVLDDVPKRLEIEYFWAIKGPDFGKEADRVLKQNFPAQALTPLRERLERLHAAYQDVKPHDRYALTYLPGIGMELSLNGKTVIIIPGADFARAYFSIWLGEKPGNASLKSQLLSKVPA